MFWICHFISKGNFCEFQKLLHGDKDKDKQKEIKDKVGEDPQQQDDGRAHIPEQGWVDGMD
jgi:hypothetical protein